MNIFYSKDNIIENQVKKDKNIIYGARSIKKRLGWFGRETSDYDIYSNSPRRSAVKLERKLDKGVKANLFYSKPAMHKGTYKVMSSGFDRKRGTEDDYGIADFTKPKGRIRTTTIQGIRYDLLSEERKNKIKSLKDKKMQFRHEKDKNDLQRINIFNLVRRY